MADGGEEMNMTEKTYTAAVIGVGKAKPTESKPGHEKEGPGGFQVGYNHGKMYHENNRVNMVAAADINQENLSAFQKTFSVEEGFEDYRKMLKEICPDIVSICTYVGIHRQMIEDAARAGVKGIFCEKPFLASPADCVAVKKVVEETGVKIVVAHIRRYMPVFIRARDLYNSGAIGNPVMCMGGIEGWDLAEWGSHWLDMFRFFNKDQQVKWVFGQCRVRDLRFYGHAIEEHGVAYLGFENGSRGFLDGGCSIGEPWSLILIGTKGKIKIRKGESELEIFNTDGFRIETYEHINPWEHCLSDLIRWIEGGDEPCIGLNTMIRTAELYLAAYLSAVRGDRIDLPLSGDDLMIDEWPVEILARRIPQK